MEIPTTTPHVIRLNRVWEVRWLAESPGSAADVDEVLASTDVDLRVDLPWQADGQSLENGRTENQQIVLATRRFNRPSNLSSGQTVLLAITAPSTAVSAFFNGEALDRGAAVSSGGRGSRRASAGADLSDHSAQQELRPPTSGQRDAACDSLSDQGALLFSIGEHICNNNRLHLIGPPEAFSELDVRLQIYA